MVRRLNVYTWQSTRLISGERPRRKQTREILAARSKAEAGRIAGYRTSDLFNLSKTSNEDKVKLAMSKVGTVFWHLLDEHPPRWREGAQVGPSSVEVIT